MDNLPISLENTLENFDLLEEDEQRSILIGLYIDRALSWDEIDELYGTYANKIRRRAKKLGIESRTQGQAQSLSLSSNRRVHPTKGIGHNKDTKIKISENTAKSWRGLSEEELEKRKELSREAWSQKTEKEIKEFRSAGAKAVRKSADEGSILEKYLLRGLIEVGYKVDFHKERWVVREKLQIDLFIPSLSVAIEVDGPPHSKDIWGAKTLKKNQLRDHEKSGMLLQQGCVIIRVKQTRALSQKYKRDVLANVISALRAIEKERPPEGSRHIILED